MALTDKLTAIADAIRAKTGKSGKMSLDQMATEIASISAGGMNNQCFLGTAQVNTTSYTATGLKLTVAKTGTYNVGWSGWRTSTSGTSGTQLYINGSAYGSAQTAFTGSYGQAVKLTGVQLTEGQEIVVRARSRSTSYYMYVANLVIEQTA